MATFVNKDTGEILTDEEKVLLDTKVALQRDTLALADTKTKLEAIEAEIAKRYPEVAEYKAQIADLESTIATNITDAKEKALALYEQTTATHYLEGAIVISTRKSHVWDEQMAIDWAIEMDKLNLLTMKPKKTEMKKEENLPEGILTEEEKTIVTFYENKL